MAYPFRTMVGREVAPRSGWRGTFSPSASETRKVGVLSAAVYIACKSSGTAKQCTDTHGRDSRCAGLARNRTYGYERPAGAGARRTNLLGAELDRVCAELRRLQRLQLGAEAGGGDGVARRAPADA